MRVGSKRWIAHYFPQYLFDGKPLKLRIGWGRVSGSRQTVDTSPWRFADPDKVRGFTVEIQRSPKPPYQQYVRTPMSDIEYADYLKSLNWFLRPEKPADRPGIDPSLLHGGIRSWRERVYHCPLGLYDPVARRFSFFDERPDQAAGLLPGSES
jgi:hypothetical protein